MSGRRAVSSAAALVATLMVGAFFSAGAQAAPGDLDLTFSGDGKQTTDFGFGDSSAAAIVRQPDGKIVAVGTDRGHGSVDFALARYNPNGTLDTSFSGDGRQTTDFGAAGQRFAEATAVALQGDGKIVVVGHAGFSDFALARYNPNGSLDTSFSGDGKRRTDFGGGYDAATGVAIQGDGKIVAVGVAGATAGQNFALARYNPNGSLDTSFSGDGKQTTDFAGSSDEEATGVALQGDGKIVVVGGEVDFGSDFALARYNPNGSLDTSFSGDGKQTTGFGSCCARASGLVLQGDGKIVAVGHVGVGDFAVTRYSPNGTLDTSFSADGKQTTDFGGGEDGATGVSLQGDGKIVAVGFAGAIAGQNFALTRYNANGSLDMSFSGDGKQTTDFRGGDDGAAGVAIQTDGKIVAVGHAGVGAFALARYNANGTLDASFSGDGKQTTDFGGDDQSTAVALQGDGKIVAVGRGGSAAGQNFALARYNPNGSLDTSFSGDGKQITSFGAGDDRATAVALQGNGKIVAVGDTGAGFALARYNPNGSLDTSFSGDGQQVIGFVGGEFGFSEATGVALQGDGKIVVVGRAGDTAGQNFALARFNVNGSLDPSFSGDGKQTTSFSIGGFAGATGVALQGNGKIIAVGDDGGGDFALARYNPNGSLDTSFSGDGKQTTDFGGDDQSTAVALQGDGKIVAVGRDDGFALARYNPNGSLDASFSGDGKQTTSGGAATGVALQGDGNIVAAGVGPGPNQSSDFALARYLGG